MAVSIERATESETRYPELVADFRERTRHSAESFARACEVLPGGDTRTVAFHPPYPLSIELGQGAMLVDADGNEYVDFLNNYTSLIHGHAHPAVTEAVTRQLPKGTNYAAAIEAQQRLARLLCDRVASVDRVRFTNSGTEATMNAVRAARAFTGRELIVKMEGGYHGTYDDFEVSVHPDLSLAGPDDAPVGVIDTRGVVQSTLNSVAVIPFNAIEAAEKLFAERGSEVAAVIVEPVMGGAGLIPAERGFLAALRDLTTRSGGLLIFDEVMSFRLEYGGIQSTYDVTPDLTAFAKIIGGGFPVGAFGGRADVMQQFDPASPNPLWQSGTFNGNAVTMIAGLAAMEHFPETEVQRINALGERLRTGVRNALTAHQETATVTGYGSFAAVHFTEGAVRNYRDAARGDQSRKRLLHLALLLEGLFCAPRLMFCTSTAMDEKMIDRAIGQFNNALDRI